MTEPQNGGEGTPKTPTVEELQLIVEAERKEKEEALQAKKRAEAKAREFDIENKKLRGEHRDDDERPLTRKEFRSEFREMRNEERMDEELSRIISDPVERERVRTTMSENLKPSGDIRSDIERARAIVGFDKTKQERDEAARALAAKQNAGQGGMDGGKGRGEPIQLTQDELKLKAAFPNLTDEKILSMRKQ